MMSATTTADRVADLRAWALSRIRFCDKELELLAEEDHRVSIETRTERRTLLAVLGILDSTELPGGDTDV